MEDWQGCLSPECQTALLLAREQVTRRGGSVITVEDFLLALLDAISALPPFLKRQGVDLDEFVRTVQGEQPIVTEVSGDGALSSQLIYWVSSAREASGQAWLDWPELLRALVCQCERLQDKAYVAVLELVADWSVSTGSARVHGHGNTEGITPVTVTDAAWLELTEDVAVALAADSSALIWVHGQKGSGKTAWLQTLLATPGLAWVQIDPRRESEILSCDQPAIPVEPTTPATWPALILDATSPAALSVLMDEPDGLIRQLVSSWHGPMLLVGTRHPGEEDTARRLGFRLGRELETREIPAISTTQRRAILGAHQPAIEKRWNIQISAAALDYAATRHSRSVAGPGGMLQWVQRAAARLDQLATRGPVDSLALAGQQDALRRQTLVALARGEGVDTHDEALKALALERSASEVLWHERQRAGTLRRVLVEDLRQELERWVAARTGPGHYVAHHEPSQGDALGARSGNLHS